jgi:hypothetical protein
VITGARRARRLLAAHLERRTPIKLAALAAAEGVVDMPAVAEWHDRWVPHEHITAWPAVMVVARTGRALGRDDWVQGDPEHRFEWVLRTYGWVRGDGYQQTAERIELLAAALVEAQLAHPRLADDAYIHDESFTVSLSSIEQDPTDRASIAGAYIECVITMSETATTEPIATANTITVNVGPIIEEP